MVYGNKVPPSNNFQFERQNILPVCYKYTQQHSGRVVLAHTILGTSTEQPFVLILHQCQYPEE